MRDITVLEAINKYNLEGKDYSEASNWKELSCYPLPEEFIRENQDKLDWNMISFAQCLSEDFIRENQDKVHWGIISYRQQLSDNFIREFKDKVDWYSISARRQILPEDLIEEFADKVDWKLITSCQRLSEPFIRKFKDNLDIKFILNFKDISEELRQELQDTLNEDLSKSEEGIER